MHIPSPKPVSTPADLSSLNYHSPIFCEDFIVSDTLHAFPLLMKQLELMLTIGELNPRHQHTVTLYARGLTCEADTLGSCGYVYMAVYPTLAPATTS